MQSKRSSTKKFNISRESSNSPQPENSLEVISDGKLSDIARPSLSRGSTRTISQLSMQSTNVSFGLESLPNDRPLLNDPQEEELFLEEAVVDEDDNMEQPDNLTPNVPTKTLPTYTGMELGQFWDHSSPDIESKEFEKEILKIAKRFNEKKQLPKNPNLIEKDATNSSPITARSQSSISNNEDQNSEKEIDPKIVKGMEKIKKLDEILAEKVKLEKEAKAERKRMEKDWQLEIKDFVQGCGENKSKPVIQQFLALTNGLSDPRPLEEEFDVKPLFQTEVETEFDLSSCKNESHDNNQESKHCGEKRNSASQPDNDLRDEGKERLNSGKSEKSRKRNFIRRNIALAAHANEIVSLTESEQHRLDELLSDDSDLLLIENPFSKNNHHKVPSGYELDEDSKRALTDIDEKLRCLVPQSDYQSICFSPVTDDQILTDRTINLSETSEKGEDASVTKYGDKNLKKEKHYREIQQRLQDIELELKKMDQLEAYESQSTTPRISNDLLRQLLEVDSRLTSSALSILDSARSNLNTARTDISEESGDTSIVSDTASYLDTSRTSCTEKSYHDIGI